MTENKENEMIRVILCKPGETAETVEIDDDLESIQKSRVSLRLVPPYSEERRKAASEYAKKKGLGSTGKLKVDERKFPW